jgi:hypothetical protein
MQCWRGKMEKIGWADHVKTEEVLHSKDERNILRKLKKSHLE